MRLWKGLHMLLGSAGNKVNRRAGSRRARLEVEALDQRLLPSSFQWGVSRGISAPQPSPSYTAYAPMALTAGWDITTNRGAAAVRLRRLPGVSSPTGNGAAATPTLMGWDITTNTPRAAAPNLMSYDLTTNKGG